MNISKKILNKLKVTMMFENSLIQICHDKDNMTGRCEEGTYFFDTTTYKTYVYHHNKFIELESLGNPRLI